MRKLLMLTALTGGLTLVGTAETAQAQWYSYGYSRPYYGYNYSYPYYGRRSYSYSQPYYGGSYYGYSRPSYQSYYGYSRPYYGSYGYRRSYYGGYGRGYRGGRGFSISGPGFSFGYWR